MKPFHLPVFPEPGSFYLITPGWGNLSQLDSLVRPMIADGLPCLQIREPSISDHRLFDWVVKLLDFIQFNKHRCQIMLNDRLRLVQAINSARSSHHVGIHLKDGTEPKKVSEQVGIETLIGISSHDYSEKENTDDEFIDYRSISPVFSPLSKKSKSSLGIEKLRDIKKRSHVPLFALGGITPKNTKEVFQCNVTGVASIGSVFDAKSPLTAFRELADQVHHSHPQSE